MTRANAELAEIAARVAQPPVPGSFEETELDGLPDPVRRYFRASIAPGTPLARSARFAMRGSIKLGRWWVPFRARQVVSPQHGLLWAARAGGVVVGSDRYEDGRGAMEWKLLRLIPLIRAQGPDISRSTAGRAAAEAVWVPTALLPRFGVAWRATDERHVSATYRLNDVELALEFALDEDGRARSVVLDRWSDPENSGLFGPHRFGHQATRFATLDGVTIPCAGRAGYFHGTDRWREGEFFRYEFTAYHLVTSP